MSDNLAQVHDGNSRPLIIISNCSIAHQVTWCIPRIWIWSIMVTILATSYSRRTPETFQVMTSIDRYLRERSYLNGHLPSIPFKNCLSRDGLEARLDKLTSILLLQWRSEFNNAFFGGRDLDLLVRMGMLSPSFNRLPSESRFFEWILQMIGGLEEISFANVRRNCAFEGEIICKCPAVTKLLGSFCVGLRNF